MVLFVVSNETRTHNQGIIYLGKILSWVRTDIETEVLSQWEISSFPNVPWAQCLLLKPKIKVIKIMMWEMSVSVPHPFIIYQIFITAWFHPILCVFYLKAKAYSQCFKELWKLLQGCSISCPVKLDTQYWELSCVKFKGYKPLTSALSKIPYKILCF